MKLLRKLTSILLVLLLFTSCTNVKSVDDEGTYYLNLLEQFKPRDKNINNTIDNKEFDDYLYSIFIDCISDSYIYMHNNVSDYKSLNIDKPEVTWGEANYDHTEDIKELIEELDKLRSYNYDDLSYAQQYDYDLYEYSLLETIVNTYYDKYNLLFSKGNDILGNFVTILDEFVFYDEESINDYLTLLKDSERYIKDLLNYNALQAKDNLFNSDESLNYQIDYIDSFTSKVIDNALITSFNNRVNGLSFLTVLEKEEYKAKDEELIINTLIPSFINMKEELSKYLGKGKDKNQSLIDINENYAKVSIYLNTSSNDDIDDIYKTTKDALEYLFDNYYEAISDENVIYEYLDNYDGDVCEGFSLGDKQTLEYLALNMKGYFPELKESNYEVSPLDESSASDSVVAYYVSPPLDNLDLNVIRTNPNIMDDDPIYAYSVLAHEGFPGHMYENLYFQASDPNPFRATQSFIGYSEGYACYSSMLAYRFAGLKYEKTADIFILDSMFAYLLYSLCDIGVNYYGWDNKKLNDLFKEFELENIDSSEMYDIMVNQPGVFLRYGTGYAYFIDLYIDSQNELKDNFSLLEFNEALLKNGPLPFVLLEETIDEYININKNN